MTGEPYRMTLKSYLLLSGGGLVATYLVTSQPGVVPPQRAAAPPSVSSRAPAPVDIQEQAARLETRPRQDVDFSAPSRNPFRFAATPPPAAPRRDVVDEPSPVVEEAPAPLLPIRLAGVSASEDGRRTAYLVTIQGVVAVREGETVPPDYRVERIEDAAIELVAGDGSTRRLQLRP